MEKIYSRFGSYHDYHRGGKNLIISVILVVLIAYITATKIINAINPTIDRQSRIIAKRTAENLCNDSCKEIMNNMKYEDLCTINRDNDGNITMMNLNVININKVSSEIALNMQKKMNEEENSTIGISIGSITGSKLLAGRGPKINVKLQIMGNVKTSIKSEIKEAGINQSVHKIYLEVVSQMSLISPYKDTDEEVNTEVLLAESVIIGKIPQAYYDLDGLKQEDALNVID